MFLTFDISSSFIDLLQATWFRLNTTDVESQKSPMYNNIYMYFFYFKCKSERFWMFKKNDSRKTQQERKP